jgi:uncharacterized damage-inducible protein DinB
MKSIAFQLACGVLLVTAPGLQSVGVAPPPFQAEDRLSGSWSGSMGRSETQRNPIYVEMKFDGKSAVTGTITGPPSPGVIKTGTFDPATGALKFEVWVQDGGGNVALFDGTAVQNMATGRVTINNQTGTFHMTKKGAESSAAASQGGSSDATAAALSKSFGEVSGWVIKAADLVPADKYSYQPAKTVRTFGQLIGHIVDSYQYFCATAAGRKVEWSDATEKGSTDKATLAQKLKQSTAACNAAHGSAGKTDALIGNIGHTNLHYGNIITYMRMIGLVPPSS